MTVQAILAATPEVIAANERFRKAEIASRRRLRLADTSEPITWQESHAPTEAVMVKIANRVDVAGGIITRTVLQQQKCRQRKTDARLLGSLEIDQITAMEAIYDGWCFAHGKVSAGVQSYGERTAKGHDATESAATRRIRLESQYTAWHIECRNRGVNCHALLQVVVYGHSLRAVARGIRGNGENTCDDHWPKQNLVAGLDLYREMFPRF